MYSTTDLPQSHALAIPISDPWALEARRFQDLWLECSTLGLRNLHDRLQARKVLGSGVLFWPPEIFGGFRMITSSLETCAFSNILQFQRLLHMTSWLDSQAWEEACPIGNRPDSHKECVCTIPANHCKSKASRFQGSPQTVSGLLEGPSCSTSHRLGCSTTQSAAFPIRSLRCLRHWSCGSGPGPSNLLNLKGSLH